MITAAFIKELISNEQVRSVTVERNCSCEIVALLKKYVVKSSSSEKITAMEGSVFWKSNGSKKVAFQKK